VPPILGAANDTRRSHHSEGVTTMQRHHEGLPAAATVEQAIILAQLQILRRMERQRSGY